MLTNVALIDFPPGALAHLAGIKEYRTIWNGGDTDLDLQGSQIVFVNANYVDQASATVHLRENRKIQEVLNSEGLVVVFLGRCQTFHLRNLVGVTSDISVGVHADNPTACTLTIETPLTPVFSRYGNRIVSAPTVIASNEGGFVVSRFLSNSDGYSAGLLIKRKQSRCVYLPHFGPHIVHVAEMILEEIIPTLAPHLIYDEEFKWLQEADYLMPSVAAIRKEQERARAEYEALAEQLSDSFARKWADVQARWNRLLTCSGDDLKRAVHGALEAFGGKVIDVDDYWKNHGQPDRQKEEDLWLGRGVEPNPADEGVFLVEVKSSKRGTASDDDYGAVIKYLSRRKTEFKNPSLQGMLVINHSYLTAAALRPPAFGPRMVADAKRDGVVLATSWDLFRLIQKQDAGEKTGPDVRNLLLRPGLVQV